ncbi:hypothetical protein V8C86DRAFT_1332178 [Haematococcus lacustris]
MEGKFAYGKVSFLSLDFFIKLPDLNVGVVNVSNYVHVPVSQPELTDFRIKGSRDVDVIHLGKGSVVYCATAMMMGVQCQPDNSMLQYTVPSDHGNAVMISQMMEVQGHGTTPVALVAAMVSLSSPPPPDQLHSLVLPAGQPAWSGPLKRAPCNLGTNMVWGTRGVLVIATLRATKATAPATSRAPHPAIPVGSTGRTTWWIATYGTDIGTVTATGIAPVGKP